MSLLNFAQSHNDSIVTTISTIVNCLAEQLGWLLEMP